MRFILWTSGVLSLIGCSSAAGALSQGSIAPSDELALKSPLAVGAHVDLDISAHQGAAGVGANLEPVQRTRFLATDDRLEALAPGLSTVLLKTQDGKVLDFITFYAVAPKSVTLTRWDDLRQTWETPQTSAIQTTVYSKTRWRAIAKDSSRELAGQFEASWTSDSPAVTLLDEGQPTDRTAVAKQAGTVNITVTALGFSSSMRVEVLP